MFFFKNYVYPFGDARCPMESLRIFGSNALPLNCTCDRPTNAAGWLDLLIQESLKWIESHMTEIDLILVHGKTQDIVDETKSNTWWYGEYLMNCSVLTCFHDSSSFQMVQNFVRRRRQLFVCVAMVSMGWESFVPFKTSYIQDLPCQSLASPLPGLLNVNI